MEVGRIADHHHALRDVIVPHAHVAAAAFDLQAVVPTVADEVAVNVGVGPGEPRKLPLLPPPMPSLYMCSMSDQHSL